VALRAAWLVGLVAACSADPVQTDAIPVAGGESLYAVMTQLASSEEALSYFKTVDALEPQTIDLKSAEEFTGLADAWVAGNAVYISEQERMTITKYTLDGGELVKGDAINFSDYGLAELAFWVNAFVSPTKAYVVNGTTEYIAWNPQTMTITGTVPMPQLAPRAGLRAFASYTDRSVAIRDGLFYHPFYYTNDDYFEYAPGSSIAVYDVKTDELVRVIEAPCPGLDHVTQDDQGNLYFSAWIFAPGGAAVLEQPATCVAQIAPGTNEATVAFTVKEATGGLEGGVLRYTGNGKGMIVVLDPSHAPEADQGDVQAVAWADNWRFWSFDFKTHQAVEIENDPIGWNSGSAYGTTIDGKPYILVGTEEEGTTLFDISIPTQAKPVFTVDGWTMRLLKLN
jgi:hypothetical protein